MNRKKETHEQGNAQKHTHTHTRARAQTHTPITKEKNPESMRERERNTSTRSNQSVCCRDGVHGMREVRSRAVLWEQVHKGDIPRGTAKAAQAVQQLRGEGKGQTGPGEETQPPAPAVVQK